MKCPACGKEIDDKSIYCPSCGASLKKGILQDDDCPVDELTDAEVLHAEDYEEKDSWLLEDKGPNFAEQELAREKKNYEYKEYEQDGRFSYFSNQQRYNDSSRFSRAGYQKTVNTDYPVPTVKGVPNQSPANVSAKSAQTNSNVQKSNKGCLTAIITVIVIFAIYITVMFVYSGEFDDIFNEIKLKFSTGTNSISETFESEFNDAFTDFDYASALSLYENYIGEDTQKASKKMLLKSIIKGKEEAEAEACAELINSILEDSGLEPLENYDWDSIAIKINNTKDYKSGLYYYAGCDLAVNYEDSSVGYYVNLKLYCIDGKLYISEWEI